MELPLLEPELSRSDLKDLGLPFVPQGPQLAARQVATLQTERRPAQELALEAQLWLQTRLGPQLAEAQEKNWKVLARAAATAGIEDLLLQERALERLPEAR